MRALSLPLTLGLALAAAPLAAQIVVVPLDPVDPGDVEPGNSIITYDPPIAVDPFDPDAVVPADPLNPNGFFATEPRPPGSIVGEDVTTVEEGAVTRGAGAVLRGLDKLAGTVEQLSVQSGETVGLGWLQITVGECRYPVDNPSGDAYAWLVIRDAADEAPVFQGWMIASSPGLNALDNARYDVWVMSCITSETAAAE